MNLLILLACLALKSQASWIRNPHRSTASGSSLVGEECSSHTDCVQGAHCAAALCRCSAAHIPLERYCWKKIGPEQSGCTYDEQCDAVWPGASCQYSICKCPPNTKLAITKEGAVCHAPGQCPTNGVNSVLYNRNTNTPSQCVFFDGESTGPRFIGCDDYPDLHDCIDGLCCPTRALTCIQPLDTGEPGNGTVSRWFFNPISQSCQEFQFTGDGGNSNNFLTLDHCQSYCASGCPRGMPQLDGSSTLREPTTCTGNEECDPLFECTNVNGASLCCPSVDSICSASGGVVADHQIITTSESPMPFSPGSNREGMPSTIRWYWDATHKTCRTFKFYGQGGNFNNFLSEEHCLGYCGKLLCPIGSPLRSPAGTTIPCSTQSHCPRSHQCNEGMCCPTAGTVCNQPLSQGTRCSSGQSERYWFNAATGVCQQFTFSGCQGNANNFVSMEKCQKICSSIEVEPRCERGVALQLEDSSRYWRCGQTPHEGKCPNNYECHFDGTHYGCCPTNEHICSLPSSSGTICSNGAALRWFFSSGKCHSFSFNGCDGNANNFASQKECLEFCQVTECPEGGSPLVNSYGMQVKCSSDGNSCPKSHLCVKTSTNKRICCPTRHTICSEGTDEGENCGYSLRRYSFDAATMTCRPFSYGGCGGNSNNFPSRMACFNFCHSAACAPSEIVYQTSSSDSYDCSAKSCPRGYSCVQDVWDKSKRICCGAPSFGVCRGNQRPYIDYRTQQPISCRGANIDSCPGGFECAFNQDKNAFYCCADKDRTSTCPNGARLVRLPGTGDPWACSQTSQCEKGKCHQTSPFTSGVCCNFMDSVCPPTFTYDAELSEMGECSPLERSSCDPQRQSVCLFSEKKARFVCCRREQKKVITVERCPRGAFQDAHRVFCSRDKPCPPSFFCVRRDSHHIGICCRHPSLGRERTTTAAPAEKLTCPKGFSSFLDIRTGLSQKCNAIYPCPQPFMCTPTSEESTVRICCLREELRGEKCEDGTVPVSMEGHIYSCQMRSCPPGYRCLNDICCPSKALACSEPPFKGTTCGQNTQSTTRFFFDVEARVCREFDFRGCNPSANTFIDERSCTNMCISKDSQEVVELPMEKRGSERCPAPFESPSDWPQICEMNRRSCADHEKCVALATGQSVCCLRPAPLPVASVFPTSVKLGSTPSPGPASLRSLMLNMCGPQHLPVMARSGDPIQCSAKRGCQPGQSCLFSSVLMVEICCAKGRALSMYPALGDKTEDVAQAVCEGTGCRNKILYPGDTGCTSTSDCRGQAVCVKGICACRTGHVQFRRMCYWKCPHYHRNVSGVCL